AERRAVVGELEELRWHGGGRHAEPGRRNEILSDPLGPETQADIGEFHRAMTALPCIIVASEADQAAGEFSVELFFGDIWPRSGRRLRHRRRDGRPGSADVPLGLQKRGQRECLLRSEGKPGHARATKMMSNARGVLQKLEDPSGLITKTCTAE